MTNRYLSLAFLLCGLSLLNLYCSTKGNHVGEEKTAQPLPEKHRPSYHFTPPAHWMNDPNGMVYYEGEYHLFYQHYPEGTVWGPMHWGHAVSKDLVNWEHLPIALYPDSLGYIFSGSAVVDWKNTSGFGDGKTPPLVAMYTYHHMKGEKAGRSNYQTQGIAYSTDKGRTWKKYDANPAIPNPGSERDFRDPKVVWYEPAAEWIVALAVKDHVEFWSSKNLKNWKRQSAFGKDLGVHAGVWECPDLFPAKVEGTNETKWVLLLSINPGGPNGGSATQYFVGDFDGKTFMPDAKFALDVKGEKGVWLDYGRDNYATVTWSDVPQTDGRRLAIGWMSNWDYAQKVPTESWRSANTVARELVLKNTPFGYRLFGNPAKELTSLRNPSKMIDNKEITTDGFSPEIGFSAAASEMELEFTYEPGADFGVELSNSKGETYRVGFDAKTNRFYSDRTKAGKVDFEPRFAKIAYAPRSSDKASVKMHLLFDVASMELFADDGSVQMTDIFFPNEDFSRVNFYTTGGKATLTKGVFYPLKSSLPLPSKL